MQTAYTSGERRLADSNRRKLPEASPVGQKPPEQDFSHPIHVAGRYFGCENAVAQSGEDATPNKERETSAR